jgi:hypothetical protein
MFALVARPFGQQKESKRNADIQFSRITGKADFYPLTYVKEVFLHE